jgi:hypothetical protein
VDPRLRSHGPRPRASAQSAEELQYIVMNRGACFGSGLTRFLPYVPIKGCVGIYLPTPQDVSSKNRPTLASYSWFACPYTLTEKRTVMWRLKVSEGAGPWLKSSNNFLGRAVWEFDRDLGTPEERAEVKRVRRAFTENRFQKRHSEDLLMRMQVRNLPAIYF